MADPAAIAATASVAAEPHALLSFPQITFTDLAVILLTAGGVILTATAVIVGIVSIVGWRAIRASAAESARRAVDAYLKGSEFHDKVREAVAAEIPNQIRGALRITVEQAMGGGQNAGAGGTTPFTG